VNFLPVAIEVVPALEQAPPALTAAFARLLCSRLRIRTKESAAIDFFIVINLLESTEYCITLSFTLRRRKRKGWGYLPVNCAMDLAIRGTAAVHLVPKCFSNDFSYVIPEEMSLKIWMLIDGPFMAVNSSEDNIICLPK
jgi:hypothetical protein